VPSARGAGAPQRPAWYRCAVPQSSGASRGRREPGPPGPGYPAVSRPTPQVPVARFRSRAWLLLTIPLGLTTWAAFLYIGIRARRARWLAFAGLYAAMLAAWIVLDTPHHPDSTAEGLGAGLALLTWIGGGIHAIAVSNDAARRIQARNDPVLEAAKTRIERRAQGRRLLATQPTLAKEVGVGRPDVPGADDYGLIDVNHCPAATLTRLPGMTLALARRTARERVPAGGFSSVEDLGLLLDLPPGTVDQMRDTAIFVPD
jgi:DNA uptake protein ComE-like DNA-binding protein